MTTVVLGLEESEVAEEVMHFLDRSGHARVVATAADVRQLSEAVRQLEPDAVIASPAVVAAGAAIRGSVFLALDTAESVRGLRNAIAAGARGFYVWPGDRDALAGATASLVRAPAPSGTRAGAVWTVFGPRGGAGTTFVATHLASALAARSLETILVDLDIAFADLTHALGIRDERRTLADLLPVLDELTDRHLQGALERHGAGFRTLLAPADASVGLGESEVAGLLGVLRGEADRVVVHVPRGMDAATRAALSGATRVAVVLQPDVLSVRAARRALDAAAVGDRALAVVTAFRKGEVSLADIERSLGIRAVVIPPDPAVPPAQDRGELVPLRGRTGRAHVRLIETLDGSDR
ncbi:MAG: CpaE family protein [Actinomycetota bacterium]